MTDETVKQLLLDFYSNQDNVKLVDYYTSQSFFDVVKKSRSETVHSAFLAWLLAGKDFPNQGSNSPLMHFLQTLLRRKFGNIEKQEKADFNESLAEAIYAGTLQLSDINIETEKPVKDLYPKANNKDKLDIFITCDTNIPTTEEQRTKKLNIIIENKVGSVENPPEDKSIEAEKYRDERDEYIQSFQKDKSYYKKLFQTDKYYCACNSENDDNIITLFVFISVLSQKELDNFSKLTCGNERCWCEHYIQICYQDILDYLIEPQLEVQNMPEKATSWLNEYIKCLSVPAADIDEEGNVIGSDKQIIMAVTHTEQNRLLAFMGKDENNSSNKELLYTLFAINASKDYYSVGDKGLYSFEKALLKAFKDYTKELSIYKKEGGNLFKIIHKGEKGNWDKELNKDLNLFLNVNCESEYAINQINDKINNKEKEIVKIDVSPSARKLLDPFWNRNQTLILSVLHILSDNVNDDSLYKDLYEQLSTKDNTKFKIGGVGPFSKMDVVHRFVKHLWENGKKDINAYFKKVSLGPSQLGVLITERLWEGQKKKDDKRRADSGKKSVLASDRYKRIELGDKVYYLSTQWGGKYNSMANNENFNKLWKLIGKYNEESKIKFKVEVQR